ncbi:glycosyltransferase [Hyunsoonleella aquatilis]|uniref:glycosyltransferase n=1 Tax=Hyunsoonleella aquatilis TaxID=2762758 RepID=UPI001647B4B6
MLAIVIPYYKLVFFQETLNSLAQQTDQRFKVYIGDDASPESPKALLKTYEGKFDFQYHKFETNLGGKSLTKQWDRCIALTNDEPWMMILGDDDVLGENVVEQFYKNKDEVVSHGINLIRYASKNINAEGKDLSKVYQHPEIEKTTDSYFKHFSWESRSSLSEYIFQRKSYQKHGFTDFPLAWHADDKAWLDFTDSGNVFTINDGVVSFRLSPENISGQRDNEAIKNNSRRLFFKDIISDKKYTFTNAQKNAFLFEYGVLIKEQDLMTAGNIWLVLRGFLKMGHFYDGMRFLRRMYRGKFLGK